MKEERLLVLSKRRLRKGTAGYLFLLPALLLYSIFVLCPIINNIYYSFTDWQGGVGTPEFVGLHNYIRAIKDPKVVIAITNNLIWIVSTTVGIVGLALFSAMLLWSIEKGRLIFRTVYFMPSIISLVVTGIIWNWIYNPVFGILNKILESIGLGFLTHGWLGDSETALFSVILTKIWQGFGWSMVILLAGLMSMDMDLFDAAKIDGANSWQRFLFVTLPQIHHVTTVVTLISIIAGFRVFDIIFVMTQGGPANHTLVMSIYIYRQAFKFDAPNYAAALSVILAFIMLVISVLYIRIRERA